MSDARPGTAIALGRLLRVSLLPSAVADVLAGLLLGGAGSLPGTAPTLALVGSSLLVYHGGLALNDWADRGRDALLRPDRPLVSGALPARAVPPAVALGWLLAVALAAWVTPLAGAWVALLAALVVAYDLGPRGPRLGPSLLASCRALNLGLGLLAGSILVGDGPLWRPAAWLLPLAYGAYVYAVSRLGRLEDGEDPDLSRGRPARLLRLAAALLLLPALVPLAGVGLLERGTALAALLSGAAGLVARARGPEPWTAARVGAAMGLALRRLLLFGAATALLGGTPAAWLTFGLLLGLGYPASRLLARTFPPS